MLKAIIAGALLLAVAGCGSASPGNNAPPPDVAAPPAPAPSSSSADPGGAVLSFSGAETENISVASGYGRVPAEGLVMEGGAE